jgi:hypothetical protein
MSGSPSDPDECSLMPVGGRSNGGRIIIERNFAVRLQRTRQVRYFQKVDLTTRGDRAEIDLVLPNMGID